MPLGVGGGGSLSRYAFFKTTLIGFVFVHYDCNNACTYRLLGEAMEHVGSWHSKGESEAWKPHWIRESSYLDFFHKYTVVMF